MRYQSAAWIGHGQLRLGLPKAAQAQVGELKEPLKAGTTQLNRRNEKRRNAPHSKRFATFDATNLAKAFGVRRFPALLKQL